MIVTKIDYNYNYNYDDNGAFPSKPFSLLRGKIFGPSVVGKTLSIIVIVIVSVVIIVITHLIEPGTRDNRVLLSICGKSIHWEALVVAEG